MTTPFRRRRPARRPANVILSATTHWRVAGPEQGREVLVRRPDGAVVTRYLPDDHPALQAFLARAAVAA